MEPLKNVYSNQFISDLAQKLKKNYTSFNSVEFLNTVFDNEWPQKELKQRMRHITNSLHIFLPKNYQKALNVLIKVAPNYTGFAPMFFPDFVETYGLDHFNESIKALEFFTQFSSSEFAVRPFIIKYPVEMMTQMMIWSTSENEHVRRLASEGCRPRLPWALSLPTLKKDPSAILPILNQLKSDSSLYVRKSVANNINDIAKDHPNIAIKLITKWKGKNKDTNWICKHAARTLLKQGNSSALKAFGLASPSKIKLDTFKADSSVKQGQDLNFSFSLSNTSKQSQLLRIEYSIEFLRLNNRTSQKMFMISETTLSEKKKNIIKKHSFKKISTRKYYPGKHTLRIFINGVEVKKILFQLV